MPAKNGLTWSVGAQHENLTHAVEAATDSVEPHKISCTPGACQQCNQTEALEPNMRSQPMHRGCYGFFRIFRNLWQPPVFANSGPTLRIEHNMSIQPMHWGLPQFCKILDNLAQSMVAPGPCNQWTKLKLQNPT